LCSQKFLAALGIFRFDRSEGAGNQKQGEGGDGRKLASRFLAANARAQAAPFFI
jgi:hypothetical protein